MIITAIDTSDSAGKLARWFAPAFDKGKIVEMKGKTPSKVIFDILSKAEGQKIERLNFIDHGNKSVLTIGETLIDAANFKDYHPAFSRLKGKFEKAGFIHLLHCEVGWAFGLLEKIASTTGVTVYGGKGLTSALTLKNPSGLHGVFPNGGGLCISSI